MTPLLSAVAIGDSPAPLLAAPLANDAHALGESIAALAVRIHAATYELLVLLREFDERQGWNTGFLSCAHWLHSTPTHRPRALGAPDWRTSIDLGAAREKVRVARALPSLPLVSAEMRRGRLSYAKVRALTPEVDAVVQRALEAAADMLFHDAATPATGGGLTEETNHAQRRADALGLIAETALSASLDAGTAGDRYQVVVHVSAETPKPGGQDAAIEVDHGALHVSTETSRRLSCDASVVRMDHDATGAVLDVGRKTRTIPPSIRRALAARDTGCQFPGCTSRRCDAHHIEHWADGGATSIDNLVLLCRRHHRAVHEGGFGVLRTSDGQLAFVAPGGIVIPPVPPAQIPTEALPPLPGAGNDLPVWDGTPFDLTWAIDVLYRREGGPRDQHEEDYGYRQGARVTAPRRRGWSSASRPSRTSRCPRSRDRT